MDQVENWSQYLECQVHSWSYCERQREEMMMRGYKTQRHYTLSHLENDRDVTEQAHGHTLQDAFFIHKSGIPFKRMRKHRRYTRNNNNLPLERTLTVTIILNM